MGPLSRFQTHAAAPSAAPGAAVPEELWRKTDFLAFAAGEDLHLVHLRGGAPQVLPSFAVDFALGCEKFAHLDAHVSDYAELHGWNPLQEEALQHWLPKLIDAGLLISSAQAAQACAAAARAEAPPQIAMIGFPTGGNRAPLLGRALRSFVENAQAHGRAPEFVIADGSADPEHVAAFLREAEAIQAAHPVRLSYAGLAVRRRFADALTARGCDAAALEFALFDPLQLGFNCGANRNALLLYGAGGMFCSVDDDVICRLAISPEFSDGVALFSVCDPFSRRLYPDAAAALTDAQFVDRDFLALHERLLGRDLAGIVHSGASPRALELRRAGDELLRRIQKGPLRVRASFSGHIGDPGIPTSIYYLYYEEENLSRLTASEAHYRSVFASRSVFTSSAQEALGDASVSPGMAMCLDHRTLLPPFFPVLHAEDFVFGATLWQCCGDALLGHTPFAVQHEPPAGKSILLPSQLFGGEKRAVVFEFAHLLRHMILSFRPAEHQSAAERMRALGRYLAERAQLPAPDFLELLHSQVLQFESGKIAELEKRLDEESSAPDFWRRDLEAYLDHLREALTHDDFDIPFDLKGSRSPQQNRALIQELIARYAALLQEWPGIFEAARQLRAEGQHLAAPLPARV